MAFRAIEQPIDTSTAAGRAFLGERWADPEFQTATCCQRELEGIAAAKVAGVCRGRKPTIKPEVVAALKAEGMGATEIAKRLKIGRASVYRGMGSPRP